MRPKQQQCKTEEHDRKTQDHVRGGAIEEGMPAFGEVHATLFLRMRIGLMCGMQFDFTPLRRTSTGFSCEWKREPPAAVRCAGGFAFGALFWDGG